MAATSQPLATQVAIEILKQGGSAVDAAIAANATLGLMEPTGNGIGGDLFAIVWIQSEKKLYGLNASGRSPKSLTLAKLKKELGDANKIPALGPLPVSVPCVCKKKNPPPHMWGDDPTMGDGCPWPRGPVGWPPGPRGGEEGFGHFHVCSDSQEPTFERLTHRRN